MGERLTRAAEAGLFLVEFEFTAVLGEGGARWCSVPAKTKQGTQTLGFSERRVIRPPQQTQMHSLGVKIDVISNLYTKAAGNDFSQCFKGQAMSFESNWTEYRIVARTLGIYKSVDTARAVGSELEFVHRQ